MACPIILTTVASYSWRKARGFLLHLLFTIPAGDNLREETGQDYHFAKWLGFPTEPALESGLLWFFCFQLSTRFFCRHVLFFSDAELTCFPFLANITFVGRMLAAASAVSYVKSTPLEDYRRGCEDTSALTPAPWAQSTPVFGKMLFQLKPQ